MAMIRTETAIFPLILMCALGSGCNSSAPNSPEEVVQTGQFALTRTELDGDYLWPTSGVIVAPGANGFSWRYRFGGELSGWQQPSFDASTWLRGGGGFYFGDSRPGDATTTPWPTDQSDLWARATFTVNADAVGELMFWGRWDDQLTIYINGVQAAHLKDWGSSYRYVGISPEARATIRDGVTNTIAVHVRDTGGGKYMDLGLVRAPQLTNAPVSGYAVNPALDVVTNFVKEQMSRYGVTAGVVAIGRGSALVLSRGIGFMDKQFTRAVPHDAVMRLASLDKMPTKDIIHQMVARAVVNPQTNKPLTYDTKVLDFLASYGIRPVGVLPDVRWQDVTIQHLLDHTSGVASMSEDDYFATVGVSTSVATIDDNARYLLSKPLEWTPGALPEHYSSTGYMLLRYVAHLLSGNIESYLQNQLLAPAGTTDMYIAHERIENRITNADGSLREPWYATFELPHDRWIGLDNFTAFSSSADAYTLYQLFLPGAGLFYGGMAGTQSVTQQIDIEGERVAFTAIFNQCCAIPTRNAEEGLLGLDGEIEQRLRQLPESAWRPPQQPSEVTCNLGPVVTWDNGYVFGDVIITNTSAHTITSWAIALDYAETPNVQQMYDYSYTYSGNRVVIKSAYPWSGTLLPGQTRHMAVQGSHDGSFTPPTCMGL